jgi:hypothetical protein
VEVGSELDIRQPVSRRGEELPHLARVRHPGRVAKRDLIAARIGQTLGDLEHAARRDLALVGTAEDDRDDALAPKALLRGPADGPPQPLERV